MQLYKLTDSERKTQNNTQWGDGITHQLTVKPNPRLCSGDVLHAYKNINLAYLLSPIHANYTNPITYLAEGEIAVEDWGKVGCFGLTTVKEIEPPIWVGGEKETLVRVAFAVLCAESVLAIYEDKYPNDSRVSNAIKAAKEYLSNPTASAAADAVYAARAAHAAARAAARAAADDAAYAAYAAARAAAYAAHAAARAAADAAYAAYAAARAADAAYVASATARAADAAYAPRAAEIDFCLLANTAVELTERSNSNGIKTMP